MAVKTNTDEQKHAFFEPMRLADISVVTIIFYLIVVPTLVVLWLNLFMANLPAATIISIFALGGGALIVFRSFLRFLNRRLR